MLSHWNCTQSIKSSVHTVASRCSWRISLSWLPRWTGSLVSAHLHLLRPPDSSVNAVFVSADWEKQIDGSTRVIGQVASVQVNEGSRRSMEIPGARTRKWTESRCYVWRTLSWFFWSRQLWLTCYNPIKYPGNWGQSVVRNIWLYYHLFNAELRTFQISVHL